MKFLSTICLVLSILLAGCASSPKNTTNTQAQDEPISETVTEEEVKGEDGQPRKIVKICKAYAPTGSRIGKKVCRTKEAWDEIAKRAKDALDNSTKPQSNNHKEQGG